MNIPGAAAFAGKRVAVLGLGISGCAAITALTEHTSAIVSAWDGKPEALVDLPAGLAASAHSDPKTLVSELLDWQPDVVVIAPAFPATGLVWEQLRAADVPVWSEIELAWHLRAANDAGEFAPWICVTGTNGKTTTVTMAASILQAAGLGGAPIGNVGNPAVTAVSDTSAAAPKAFVLELSSFQLYATYSMEPVAAICLNLADDHLEWHGSIAEYQNTKAKIYRQVSGTCFYPAGDRHVAEMLETAAPEARKVAVTLAVPSVDQIGLVEDIAVDRAFPPGQTHQATELFTLDKLTQFIPAGAGLPAHLVQDALSAAALTRAIGVDEKYVAAGLANAVAGKHRITEIANTDGVRWVDDSKATNAHAARAALATLPPASTVWIVGGLAKGARFEQLVAEVESHLAAVVVIGKDQKPWRTALADLSVPTHFVSPDSESPMEEAVQAAARLAQPGNTVLLAPATASMDQFVSYADRGDKFAAAVAEVTAHG